MVTWLTLILVVGVQVRPMYQCNQNLSKSSSLWKAHGEISLCKCSRIFIFFIWDLLVFIRMQIQYIIDSPNGICNKCIRYVNYVPYPILAVYLGRICSSVISCSLLIFSAIHIPDDIIAATSLFPLFGLSFTFQPIKAYVSNTSVALLLATRML